MNGILKRGRGSVILAGAGVLLTAWCAGASLVRFMPFTEQCSSAELIVFGRAGQGQSSWDQGGGIIYTNIPFTVERTVKGSAPGLITIRQVGGRVGDIAQSVSGGPEFVEGASYVLFLELRPDGNTYRVIGLSQGLYPVAAGADGKSKVRPGLAASPEWLRMTARSRQARIEGVNLEEFIGLIRRELETQPIKSLTP